MKKSILAPVIAGAMLSISACSTNPSKNYIAEEIKEECMQDEMTHLIYKDDAEEYCECVAEKIIKLDEDINIDEDLLDEIIQDCADNFTSLDIDF